MSQDNEFNQYLKGNSALTQVYAELPDAALSAHLDAAILAEAHRAVNARPGAKPKRRWTIPLGMVATLFVVVMAGLQLPHMLKDAATPQRQQEEKMTAMMDTGIAGLSSDAPETHKKIQESTRALPKEKSEIIRAEAAIKSSDAGAPVKMSAPVVERPQKSEVSESRSSSNALMAPAAPMAAPVPQAAKPMGFSGSGYIAQDKVLSKEKKASGHVQDRLSDALEQSAPAAAMIDAPQPLQLKRALVQPVLDEAVDENLLPDEWLIRIKRLKEEGKRDEVRKELAAFKKRYPDRPIPVTLEIK